MLRPVTGGKKKKKEMKNLKIQFIRIFAVIGHKIPRDNRSTMSYEDTRYNVNNDRNNFANRFLIITFYYLSLGLVTKLERNFL